MNPDPQPCRQPYKLKDDVPAEGGVVLLDVAVPRVHGPSPGLQTERNSWSGRFGLADCVIT